MFTIIVLNNLIKYFYIINLYILNSDCNINDDGLKEILKSIESK